MLQISAYHQHVQYIIIPKIHGYHEKDILLDVHVPVHVQWPYVLHLQHKFDGTKVLFQNPPTAIESELASVLRSCSSLRSDQVAQTLDTIQRFRSVLQKSIS